MKSNTSAVNVYGFACYVSYTYIHEQMGILSLQRVDHLAIDSVAVSTRHNTQQSFMLFSSLNFLTLLILFFTLIE